MNLQEAIEEAGYEVRSYSGRGMFGRECLAADLGDHTLGAFIANMMTVAIDCGDGTGDDAWAIAEAFRDMRTDSMGLGIVVYFPNQAAAAGEEGEP